MDIDKLIAERDAYRATLHLIANDYYELSHEKIKWQRDDWKKRAAKVLLEYWTYDDDIEPQKPLDDDF